MTFSHFVFKSTLYTLQHSRALSASTSKTNRPINAERKSCTLPLKLYLGPLISFACFDIAFNSISYLCVANISCVLEEGKIAPLLNGTLLYGDTYKSEFIAPHLLKLDRR